jgi:hypothetical protein
LLDTLVGVGKDSRNTGEPQRDADALRIPGALRAPLAPEVQNKIEAAAIDANERYIVDFLEEHAFCPFSKGGRAQGKTVRFVHYSDSQSIAPLVALMERASRDPERMVVQVILPMLEVNADTWIQFCNELTVVANKNLGTGSDVYAVAAMHPHLNYERSNPAAMIPLLRRSPDPTIQWVRLDDLEALYAGRSGETKVVDLGDPTTLLAQDEQTPLFERITEANLEMAEKLGFPAVERALSEFEAALQKRYQAILAGRGA